MYFYILCQYSMLYFNRFQLLFISYLIEFIQIFLGCYIFSDVEIQFSNVITTFSREFVVILDLKRVLNIRYIAQYTQQVVKKDDCFTQLGTARAGVTFSNFALIITEGDWSEYKRAFSTSLKRTGHKFIFFFFLPISGSVSFFLFYRL